MYNSLEKTLSTLTHILSVVRKRKTTKWYIICTAKIKKQSFIQPFSFFFFIKFRFLYTIRISNFAGDIPAKDLCQGASAWVDLIHANINVMCYFDVRFTVVQDHILFNLESS